MKSLIMLWKILAKEFAGRCRTSATMDINTVQGRSKHEGLSFLTITLPAFGKDFQKGLNQGLVSHDMFQGFSWHAGLPQFLGGFLESVFDRASGVLLDEPSIDAILAIRQLTLIFGKLSLPCTSSRERAAMAGYVKCEQEVRAHDSIMEPSDIEDFHRVSRMLFASPLAKVDSDIYHGTVVPKHGPGATADFLSSNGKFRLRTWTTRLEKIFPAMDFLFSSASHFYEMRDEVDYLEPGAEIPVKVISVPKTQKTPRIIAIEPACMQYAQQAVLESLVPRLEKDSLLSNMIGFTDQGPNQSLAREGSLTGNLATLDLSDASDRVSNQLVRTMLRDHPWLHRAVDASRSRRARVPGYPIQRLAKFASMGSALCFPFEAMVFLTIIFLGIERDLNTPLSPSIIKQYSERVRVYGDDLIVPIEHVHSVIHHLEAFGARVGEDKSFWIGRFRESCGKEYYEGQDVSIVKARRMLPASRKCVPEVISMVSLRNQLYLSGCWEAAAWLDDMAKKVLVKYPIVESSSPVLGRFSFLGYQSEKECEHLHRPLVKGYVVSPRSPRDPLDGHGALLKFFLKRGNLPSADRNHLERAGRPRAVDIKPRWAPPY